LEELKKSVSHKEAQKAQRISLFFMRPLRFFAAIVFSALRRIISVTS
jgi:hypothetical protein